MRKITSDHKDIQKEQEVIIREMSRNDLETAINWAKDEGWNPGKFDYNSYYATEKEGFLSLFLGNKMIASISIVRYQREDKSMFAFIGLFIVKREFRKRGYGGMLWEFAMKRLQDISSISLYAVPQQVKRYKKSSFFEDGRNNRFVMSESPSIDASTLVTNSMDKSNLFRKMVGYDKQLWGASRNKFFNTALKQPETFAFVSIDANGSIDGYGLIRPCIQGYRIGPFYSNSPEIAKLLTNVLVSYVPEGSNIIFDIPSQNRFSEAFAEYFNLDSYEPANTISMVKGEKYYKGDETCYGLLSLEIG